ncbi:MAG: DNA internalization-related competence protein ComEC/Rec2, partial [Proteobacteria bacterium]|nr:DNA internalization-related competence protein ComEC/Rec2 [Pseudomonadota bacterium]
LVGGFAWRIVRRMPALTRRVPARRVAAAVGLAAATAYTLLSGAEIPALRTLMMLAVATLGLWLGLPGTAGVVWLWALAAVLLVDPWASIAPGFWLSFGAVGLLLFAGTHRLAPRRPRGFAARTRAGLREGVAAQWVVTIGLAPGTLALFQQLSLVAPLANAIAIPVVTFAVVPLALLAIVVPVPALPVAAHAVLEPLVRYLEWLAATPHAAWQQHAPARWTVVVATLGVLWLVAPRGVPGRWLGLAWLLPLVLVVPARPPPAQFDVLVLDVGQGLAALVRTAGHTLLFDTGPRFGNGSDAGSRIVVPALRAAGTGTLDRLIVSHADSDHSGGALSVLASLPVGRVDSSLEWTHPIIAAAGTRAHRCAAGEHWHWDGVEFAVLYPFTADYADATLRTNNRSCVLRVAARGFTVLLTGDIEARDERALLEAAAPLAADVIVVPHHGSRTSSTPDFVATVDPRIAVFTAGYRNRFGHPRPEVVARYARLDATLLRSDDDGALWIAAHDGALAVTSARVAQRRYWHDGADAR